MDKGQFVDTAKTLLSEGFSVIPLCGSTDEKYDEKSRGKAPVVKDWANFCSVLPTESQIDGWATYYFGKFDDYNAGIPCGRASNLTVLDADSEAAIRLLEDDFKVPETLKVKTRKGYHYYFKYVDHPSIINDTNLFNSNLDIRTQGGQVAAPGSRHFTGFIYEWVNKGTPIAELPKEIIQKLAAECEQHRAAKSKVKGQRYDVTKDIVQGKRNRLFASLVGTFNHCGIPVDIIENVILELNKRGTEAEDEDIVKGVVRSASRYDTAPPKERWTDYQTACNIADDNKNQIMYAEESGSWYVYGRGRWQMSFTDPKTRSNKLVDDSIIAYVRNKADALDGEEEEKDAYRDFLRQYEAAGKLQSLRNNVSTQLAESLHQYDEEDYLFNCENVAIDLKTCKPIEHSPDLKVTKYGRVKYDVAAQCPLWKEFLNTAFEGNQDTIKYIQTALGYTMIGEKKTKALMLLIGEGGDNGKSVFLNVIGHLFNVDGEKDHSGYGVYSNFSTFTAAKEGEIRCDLAALKGARYVCASEGSPDAVMDDTVIKSATGADKIRARFLHKNEIVFKPKFTIWVAANQKPIMRCTDKAMRKRIKLINFNVTIPVEKQDRDLERKLIAESSGILNWILEGVERYNKEGLVDCDTVKNETQEYMDAMDAYKKFFDDCLVYKEGTEIEARDVYNMYLDNAEKRKNKYPMSETKFGQNFASHMKNVHNVDIVKDVRRRSNGGRYFVYKNIAQISAMETGIHNGEF